MVFCNKEKGGENIETWNVTILILIDGFLQFANKGKEGKYLIVTILILIDGFLQFGNKVKKWVKRKVTILILIDGFLQY